MQEDLAVNTVFSAINSLLRKTQINLIEKFIFENDLVNDLNDNNIAKKRISEQGTDYEEFCKTYKIS